MIVDVHAHAMSEDFIREAARNPRPGAHYEVMPDGKARSTGKPAASQAVQRVCIASNFTAESISSAGTIVLSIFGRSRSWPFGSRSRWAIFLAIRRVYGWPSS